MKKSEPKQEVFPLDIVGDFGRAALMNHETGDHLRVVSTVPISLSARGNVHGTKTLLTNHRELLEGTFVGFFTFTQGERVETQQVETPVSWVQKQYRPSGRPANIERNIGLHIARLRLQNNQPSGSGVMSRDDALEKLAQRPECPDLEFDSLSKAERKGATFFKGGECFELHMEGGSIVGMKKHGLVQYEWGYVYEAFPYVGTGSEAEKWQSHPWSLMNGSLEAQPLEVSLRVTVRKTLEGGVDLTVLLDGRFVTIKNT